jgi:hypothetical protein
LLLVGPIVGILTLLTVLSLSLVITRVATVALTLTGLSEEAARFQARSAFTGTGFTTAESEQVVNNPVRRRIVMWLMIVRSAGLVTIIISLILSFASAGSSTDVLLRLAGVVGGLLALWLLASRRSVHKVVERGIRWALNHWTELEVRDYSSLLKLTGEYAVEQVVVQEGEWLAGKRLGEADLAREGVTVLGITRDDGEYVGAPRGDTKVFAGDTLTLYGRSDCLAELSQRQAGSGGDQAHAEAIDEQEDRQRHQQIQEEQTERKKETRQETRPSPQDAPVAQ